MRQFVISARHRPTDGTLPPIMERPALLEALAAINTHPESVGSLRLYGPGVRIDLPDEEAPCQLLLSLDDEDIAWPYLFRLAKRLPIRILNLETNEELGTPQEDDGLDDSPLGST